MAIIPKGSEPAAVKKRMDTLFAKLDEAYPDKVISGLQRDHKKWSETVRELYRLLGYPDNASFLEAYGYQVERSSGGRPRRDSMTVLEELRRRYPDGCDLNTVSALEKANPDLKPALKTLTNQADAMFGMSLKEYLQQNGLLAGRDYRQELDELIHALKARYAGATSLPESIEELKSQNRDLPVEKLIYATKFGLSVKEHLLREGLLAEPAPKQESGPLSEEQAEAFLSLLKQRYADKTQLPGGIAPLTEENPDIPIRKLNKYLRAKGETKAEKYYIRNHILQGKPTDRLEYTYCMVSFRDTVPRIGDKQYAYLAGKGSYRAGDRVVVKLGYFDVALGTVTEVIRCMGVDAPWPPNQTSSILRMATASEIAHGAPALSGQELQAYGLQFLEDLPFGSCSAPDPFDPAKAEAQASLRGFVPGDPAAFRTTRPVDLRDSDWVPCEFRFRGLAPEILKLKQYLLQEDLPITGQEVVSDAVWEIRVTADARTPELIEKFPALKATGLVEHWWQQEVYAMYSESGFREITQVKLVGMFDRRQDGGDGRWEWERDMMESFHLRFEWIQTGGIQHVFYVYPFTEDWNRTDYTREDQGVIYV